MYFKRIEMHGFKSFADPVTIEFHQGITCVVGPNGSGKSNISDAIRWVLGEQSPKMLRGGKMEEVIFAGTASRKSRGMAEVTLVIDNAEGTLPIEYQEVAITRRMFRSGESEYSINNHTCRLRDIRELIMDTGIGVDGYSLIGQGKISDIISNKTESRREIFEEAAGIVMYRTKKAESERKLTAASSNLERVNDIIGEIEGRIDGLKEDSEKAREYIELRDRNRELEINIILKNIETLEARNRELNAELAEKNAKLESLQNEKASADKKLAESRKKSDNLQNLLDESREKLMRSTGEINELISRDQINQERLGTIDSSRQRIAGELQSLSEKLKKEKANAYSVKDACAQAQKELEQIQDQLRENLRQYTDLTEEMSMAAEQAEQYKDDIFQAHSRINAKKAEAASLENLKETLERRKKQVSEEKKRGEDSSRDTLDILSRLRAERKEKEEELEQMRKDLSESQKKQAAGAAEEQRLAGELEELRVLTGQLSSRKKTIEEMEHNYEGYNFAVRFIMKAGLPGIFGTVAELIQVPKGFETAVETALGAALQNIVCEDDKSAQTAIARLKENRAGRLTFLPVSSIRGGRNGQAEVLRGEPGFQGLATECVEFAPAYRNVMEYLLGRVVVVDRMDHAVRLSKKAAGLRFVTLEGEIINAGGAITGGRYKNKTANLLERKAEIGELEKRLTLAEEKKQRGSRKLEELQTAAREVRLRIASQEERTRSLEIDLASIKNEYMVLENSLSDFKEHSGRWEKELESIHSEQESSDRMIRELECQIKGDQAQIAERERDAETQILKHEAKKEEAEKLSEAITKLRIKAGACESRKAGAEEMTERVHRTIRELEAEIQQKESQAEHLAGEKESLETGSTELTSIVKEKEQEKAYLEGYIQDLAEEKAHAAKDAETFLSEKEALERQVGSCQDQKYELEVKSARSEAQMDSYKEKLWEDFEVSYIQAIEFKKKDFAMSPAVKENRRIKARMKELGEVNVGAIAEYETVRERYAFLTGQREDILQAMDSLKQIIRDMDKTIKARFKESFDQAVLYFEQIFSDLFGGGHAQLQLDDESNPLESGISIIAQPPGKKLQNINLLSGGEKTMTAIALMFAVLKTKPTPFCILDEVEAALDDANIERFARYLKTFDNIQFTLVTHQKTTMEYADVLYGVTMPEQGISKVLSLNLGDGFDG